MTASLGILVKQWLKEFLAANDVATSPQAQLRIRFFRYPGLRNWKVFEFVAVLPMLLQLALGLFLLGLCFFTSAVHPSIRNTSVPLVSLWAIIFLLVTLAPAFSPQCPYKTSFLKSAMRSLRIHFSKWSSFRSLYANSTKSVDDLRVRGNLPKRAQDDILPLPDTDSGWVDGSIHIELGPLVSGNQESVKSDTSSFEEEDAAMNDEADLEILLEVGAVQHDEQVISTLFIKSFVGTDSAPSDVIAFILRVIRNQLQKSIDVNRVSTILDLRRLSFEVWSVIIRTATGILKREVDAQLGKDRDTVEWNDWMGDSMALLISLTSYPLPAESHQLLSKLLIVDPLSVITFISSRLPPQFVPSDHIHLLRSLRSVVSALPSRERGHHISKLLRQRTFPDITEEQRSWAQYVQRYLVESSAEEVGFPLLHAYHELEPPASHTMSLLVRLLKCQFKLKEHPPSKLNVIMNLRTLPANDWSAAVKVASAVILSSIDKKAINAREMEASHSIMNALLVLLSYSKHPMPYEGLKALSKLLMTSTEACMDILPTKVRDNSTLDHVVLRLSTALHIVSDNMQALHVTSFLWSRHQGFKRYSVSEVDDGVKTGLTARLMESLLRSSASDILPLFIKDTRRTNHYSSDTMQFTYKLLSHVLQIPFSESGENPILDLSALDVEIWRALMIMLVGLLQTKIPRSSSQGPPYPTWVQDALTLLISTYKEPLPDECQDWLRRFLHDTDDSATLVANIAFPKTSEAGRFAAVYRNLQPTLELLPIESMLTYITSILSNRFCQCSVKDQKHDTTLIELLNAHAADITSDAFDTIAEHLMAIVDTSLGSTVPVVPSAQVAVSVLLSPQFAVAASSGSVATRRTWIANQLVKSSRTHILLHVISANHGLGRPQMTTIVHIILEIIINGTWRTTLPVLSRALGEHTIRCDIFSPLDPFMICDFIAELCEAHVLYHLTHNPDTEIRDVLRRWKNVWLNLAVAFEAFPSMGHNVHDTSQISKCLDRLQQLQSATKMSIEERTQSHNVASSSDFLVPFFLILALQKAAKVLSSSDDTNIGFPRGSVLNKTRRSTDIEAMATRGIDLTLITPVSIRDLCHPSFCIFKGPMGSH
ncbi:hypothetical protein QCA50_001012 [Cerrena zonata]|uniref:DUF6535 domain-containing protein n=1 Tax=Cerrena zonata TaxID=2478898 RepID=A0AAW0GS03_9APHY